MAEKKGRPTRYTKAIAEKICIALMEGKSLRRICSEDEDLPDESTIRKWAYKDLNGFYPQYARARDIGIDSMVDETLDIADDGTNDWQDRLSDTGEVIGEQLNHEHVQRSRLRIDTRKWYVSKIAPNRYGNKIEQQHSAEEDVPDDYSGLTVDETPPDATVL